MQRYLLPVFFGLGCSGFVFLGAEKYFAHWAIAAMFAALVTGLFTWCVHANGWRDWRSLGAWLVIMVFHGLSGEANITHHAGSDARISNQQSAEALASEERLMTAKSEAEALLEEIESLQAEVAALIVRRDAANVASAEETAAQEAVSAAERGMEKELENGGIGPRYRAYEADYFAAQDKFFRVARDIERREERVAAMAEQIAALNARAESRRSIHEAKQAEIAALTAATAGAKTEAIAAKADSLFLFRSAQVAAAGDEYKASLFVVLFFCFAFGTLELIYAALITQLSQEKRAEAANRAKPAAPTDRPPSEKKRPLEATGYTIPRRQIAPVTASPPRSEDIPLNVIAMPRQAATPIDEEPDDEFLEKVQLSGRQLAYTAEDVLEGLGSRDEIMITRRCNWFGLLERKFRKPELDKFLQEDRREKLQRVFGGYPPRTTVGDILCEAARRQEEKEASTLAAA